MKAIAATVATHSLAASAQTPKGLPAAKPTATLTLEDIRSVAPALREYTQRLVTDEVWQRPELNPRDRSVVTVAALIARNQATEMPSQFRRALDNGVKPSELSMASQFESGRNYFPFVLSVA